MGLGGNGEAGFLDHVAQMLQRQPRLAIREELPDNLRAVPQAGLIQVAPRLWNAATLRGLLLHHTP